MISQFFTHLIFEKVEFSHSVTQTSESSNFKNSVEILAGLVSVFEQGCFLHVSQLYVSHFVVTSLLTL